jgi:hypothetical protein
MHQTKDAHQVFFFGILFLSFFRFCAERAGILTKMKKIKAGWFFSFD